MKKPRMTSKQSGDMNEDQMVDNCEAGEGEESEIPYQWSVDTIVVNGQPMTVTFPLEDV
jgi:hypothetical protein